MEATGYNGIKFTLIDSKGYEVDVGYQVTTSHGATTSVLGATPPHKEGASGYVETGHGRHYASVYDMAWLEL